MITIDFKKIEQKWQKKWEKAKIFEANPSKKKKFFITIPYPYVNGSPHIGAGFTFFRGDVYARFKRMQGFNVLFPQGFHATGEPILGAIERLEQKDKVQIETFKLYGATDKDLKDFVKYGPEFVAKYWMRKWIEILKLSGFSIDWRRTFITTTMTPTYSRFIEWQYNTLRKKGYVTQGTHPVVWCPHCKSPTGDHDRLQGEGESPIEYIVIKFRLDSGEIIPCGTLRPETVYGVTNIWIDPSYDYVKAKVNNEVWILSEKAVGKLRDQLKNITLVGKIRGSNLIGKYVEDPVTNNKIMILPANFVDPNSATGIVMSVLSHAPYDWVALRDLQKDPRQLRGYGVETQAVKEIKPISLISAEGFGEHPAIEIVENMGIKNQNEKEKLDKATGIVYKKEFHTGVLKENCREYSGLKVSEAKDKLVKDFLDKNFADIMWEITGKVVCRCTTTNHVKILENQWFLKFSDAEWKQNVKECIAQMKFYPEVARIQFLNTVDWLKDKACTRKTGLGTKLPWDKNWIIETLSDSVIYMAYYTITKIINENKIEAEELGDEVFDYVFLGNGNELSRKFNLEKNILNQMREEFEYFYPVDLRTSGKDLVQNHLTYFLFHHVAMWESKHWPRAIGVNGYVNVLGTKMSKSKGNIIPLKDLIENVGADLVRINIVSSNENMDDADWRDESVASYQSRIEFLFELINNIKKARRKSIEPIDKYLVSRLQENIKKATEAYEEMRFRTAVQHILFDTVNDLKWYIELKDGIKNCSISTLSSILEETIKLLSPITPHTSEEMWSRLGKRGFVSTVSWPEYKEKLIDKEAIELEEIFRKILGDIEHILKLAGKKNNMYVYVVTEKEFKHLKISRDYIKNRFGFKKVEIFKTKDAKKYDPQNKSSKAKYGKPGIYLE